MGIKIMPLKVLRKYSGQITPINWRAIPPTVKDCQLRIVKGLILSHETPPPPLGRSKVTALFYGFGRREYPAFSLGDLSGKYSRPARKVNHYFKISY